MAKSKYATHVLPKLDLIKAWCRDGAIDEDIWTRLKISKQSFYTYKEKYVDFFDSLKEGKESVDIQVENSLLKKALGYKYDEVTYERVYFRDKEEYEVAETKRVTKEVQPDTTAQIYWLNNRKPKEWRSRQEVDNNVTVKTYEQLLKEIKEKKQKQGI